MKRLLISTYLSLLKLEAQLQLRKNRPLVIGITGSAGKSSCTKAVATVLSPHFKLKYTKKGNSETGIPQEILDIPVGEYSPLDWALGLVKGLGQLLFNWEKYAIFVAEMGIDSDRPPKDMATLLGIIEPEIGVLLNVTNVHLQNFQGPKTTHTVAAEKGQLLFNLPENGLAIYNADQPEFKNFENKIKANRKTFSTSSSQPATIQLLDHQISLDGSRFQFTYQNQKHWLAFPQQLFFKEAFGSFATAILIANWLKIAPTTAIQDLKQNYKILPGRGRLLKGLNKSLIIDSSYNSALEPTVSSLKMLPLLKKSPGRTITVLGDMRELGEKAETDHQALEKVALASADLVFTVGPLTSQYFSNPRVKKYRTAYEVIADLKETIKPNDLILIKGSQNTILLEIVVKELLANPQDKNQLCRQTPFWENEREKLRLV